MSKPNHNQMAVLKILQRQIHYWQRTNDITSPTHTGDINEDLKLLELDGTIPESIAKELYHNIALLWITINKI